MPAGIEAARLYAKVDADTRGATRGLDDVSRAVDKAGRGFNVLDEIVKGTLRELGAAITNSLLSAGRSLLDFGAQAVEVGKTFEQTFSGIEAILQPTNEELALLQTLAEEMGATTKFSATEAASAIEMLGRNGLDTAQILGGALAASMSLAASTGSDLSMSADVATDAMSVFGIEASNMAGAVDLLAGATVNSKFTLDDMRLALAQGGGAAAAAGVPFDEFTTIIAGIAPSFASGSDAGTSFKTFLQRLVPASGPAREAMADLNLLAADGSNAFFDAAGNLKSMSEISGILKNALSGLTEEQKTATLSVIFGADALRAATAVAGLGTTGYNELAAAVGSVDAEGQAAIRMDNLAGKQELLASAVEGLQLKISQFLNPVILVLTERATGAVNAISAFIGEIQASDDPLHEMVAAINTVIPGFQGLVDFIRVNVAPILLTLRSALVGIGTVITVNVVPAIAGAVAAFALVNAPVVALIALIGALYAAWETNFGSIRDMTAPLFAQIRDTITLTIETIRTVIAAGLAFVTQLWQTHGETIQTIVSSVWGLIQHHIESKIILIQGILNTVMAVANKDWAGAWQTIRDTALRLFEHAKEGVLGKVLGLGQGVITRVQESAPSILEGLGVWARAFVEWITQAWQQLQPQLVAFALSIVEWVQAQVPSLAGALLTWGRAFAAWVVNAIPPMLVQLGVLISNLLDWAGQQIAVLVPQLAKWGAAFAGWVGRVWAELQPLLITLIGQVFDWITQQAPPIIERIGAWAGAFYQWVLNDAAPQLILNLGTLIGQVLDWIGAQIAVLVPQLAEWAAAFYRWILTVWPGMLENLLMLSSLLIAWILERVPIIAAQLRVWGEAFGAWVMAEGWPLLFDAMTTLIGMVTAWLAEQVPVIAGALGEWAVAFVSWVIPAFAQLILKLGEMVGTTVLPWIVEQAPRLTEKLLQWAAAFAGWVLTEAWPALQTALGEFWANILGWITGQSEQIKTNMLSFGHNMVAGVREGIAQKWDEFTAWLRDKFSGLPGPIKQALGIASPSKVMATEVGSPIIQGIADGMQQQSGSMIEMMRQLMGGPSQTTGLYAAAKTAGGYFHTIGGWLVERLLAGMRETWQQVVQFFNAELDALFGDVDTMPAEKQGRAASRAFAEGMRKEWNAQKGDLYDMFTESSDVMTGGAVSALEAATLLARILPDILSAFRDMGGRLGEMHQIGADVMNALHDGMQEGLVAIEDDAERIGNAIIDAMLVAWDEQQEDIFDRAEVMGQKMVDALGTAFDDADMVGAGQDYVDGIITGIDNREATLMDRISALAASMVDGLQSSLEISSPSRLMATQVGAPIAEGIAAGIMAAKPAIDMALGAATASPVMAGAGGTTINNTYNTTNNLSVAPVPTTNLNNELDMMAARRR